MKAREIVLGPFNAEDAQEPMHRPITVDRPFAGVALGNTVQGGRLIRVKLSLRLAESLTGDKKLGAISVHESPEGVRTIVPEQPEQRFDPRLLLLVNVAGGHDNRRLPEGGTTIWTAATSDLVDCPERRSRYPSLLSLKQCPQCKTALTFETSVPVHPDTGKFQKWRPLSAGGIIEVAHGFSGVETGFEDRYKVGLVILPEGGQMRIARLGQIPCDEPAEVFLEWSDQQLSFSYDIPDQSKTKFDLTEGRLL